ncbi:MAG: glycosyltransferase, partial [Candidatus Riesia sp.]|nr:glycosyltransferase [Candidatus Riesia sp.]
TLQNCFLNFLNNVDFKSIDIIMDNVTDETADWVNSIIHGAPQAQIYRTSSNNAESFKLALDLALEHSENEIIYFVEDDYIHAHNSTAILLEGLEISNYVSLYDHPDKYGSIYNYAEDTITYVSKSVHWRRTISTPMTFACHVKTLVRDKEIILESLKNRTMTWSSKMFKDLAAHYNEKQVMTPMPSYATHGMTMWVAPLRDWEQVMWESLK